MKRIALAIGLVATLAACASRDAPTDTAGPEKKGAVAQVGAVLGRAFASTSDSKDGLRAIEGGGLCGDPVLKGVVVGRVPGRIAGCGIENAVRLDQVGQISLSQGATINCATAKAFKTWIETGAMPAFGDRGGGLAGLKVAASYACRTRNHRRGAKISEHGKGNAIDISAFFLLDGTEIPLLGNWNSGTNGQAMKKMHAAACGPFKTVLGPDSDRWHQDHFHFDVAQHRGGGTYCR
ncbi:extensin family protein [Cognatishimia sp. F0-27]|uniref:extensin-like domain-containing protein n=1 Tax=Cognatishimia sp. F0-27 TaxID=2816855 RepID=UPI001D0C8645|nr:extensin family protein [Cognatishimia sp. F0-27]MCC1491364.1 extensin family protein [Cognatishimia sp. F0-27]